MSRRLAVLAATVMSCALLSLSARASAQSTVSINITSTPAGAQVFLDSATGTALGVTPITRARVARGPHTFFFRLEGYADAQVSGNIRVSGSTVNTTLAPLARLTLSAGADSANGATVNVQGESWGPLPVQRWVRPGRYLVTVSRDGFQDFSQWVDLSAGQSLALPVQLTRVAARTGSISVVADLEGTPIFLDGQARGVSPAVLDDVPEGDHVLELRPTAPNTRTATQTIHVTAGHTVQATPSVRVAQAQTGSLRVFSSTPGAQIAIDGEVLGGSPQQRDLPPGDHVVEVTADGFVGSSQTVTVTAGQQNAVRVVLDAAARAPGRIEVNAAIDGATVVVDGQDRGEPPVVIEGAPAGTHAIIVRAPGRREFRQTCQTAPGQNCTINATLDAVTARVRIQSERGSGGQLVIDGQVVGTLPWDGQVPVGQHLVEVRASGYRPYSQTLDVTESGEVRLVTVNLTGVNERTAEESAEDAAARADLVRRAFIHTADPLPTELAVIDVYSGWPYLGGARLSVGLSKYVDAGLGFRTFGRLNEFEGRVRVGTRIQRLISVGGQVRFGGGVGPAHDTTDLNPPPPATSPTRVAGDKTNSVYVAAEALATLHFSSAAAITVLAAIDVTSDRWNAQGSDRALFATSSRQTLARGRFGFTLDFAISRSNGLFLRFEGVAGQQRRVYGDIFGAGNADKKMYGEIGFTHKFDSH